MASFKAKFPVLQELFAKNHRGGPLGPPSGARVNGRNPENIVFFQVPRVARAPRPSPRGCAPAGGFFYYLFVTFLRRELL